MSDHHQKPTGDTDRFYRKERQFNLNTLLLGAMTLVLTVTGWSLSEQVHDMKSTISDIRTAMMPRQEVEARLKSVEIQLEDLKVRVMDLESRPSHINHIPVAGQKSP